MSLFTPRFDFRKETDRMRFSGQPLPPTWEIIPGLAPAIGLSYVDARDVKREASPSTPPWVDKIESVLAKGWPADMPPVLALRKGDRYEILDGNHRHKASMATIGIMPVLWIDDTEGRMSRYINDTGKLPLKLEREMVSFLKSTGWQAKWESNWDASMAGEKPSWNSLSRPPLLSVFSLPRAGRGR